MRGYRPVALGGEAMGLLALTRRQDLVTTASMSFIEIYFAVDGHYGPARHLEYQRASRHAPPQQVGETPD
jgi:hypothetical protein